MIVDSKNGSIINCEYGQFIAPTYRFGLHSGVHEGLLSPMLMKDHHTQMVSQRSFESIQLHSVHFLQHKKPLEGAPCVVQRDRKSGFQYNFPISIMINKL